MHQLSFVFSELSGFHISSTLYKPDTSLGRTVKVTVPTVSILERVHCIHILKLNFNSLTSGLAKLLFVICLDLIITSS